MKGIDTSHWNSKIDWSKVKTDFVFQKCTEGTNYKDPTYETNKKGARKAGLIFGSYHFAKGGDVIKEAQYFIENVNDIQDGELLALDWEIEHPTPVGWCKDFIKIVEQKTGKDCWLYTNDVRATKYEWPDFKFWIARYGANDGTQNREPNFKNWAIWQYTSRGKMDGISGNVDLNFSKVPLVYPNSQETPVSNIPEQTSNNAPVSEEMPTPLTPEPIQPEKPVQPTPEAKNDLPQSPTISLEPTRDTSEPSFFERILNFLINYFKL